MAPPMAVRFATLSMLVLAGVPGTPSAHSPTTESKTRASSLIQTHRTMDVSKGPSLLDGDVDGVQDCLIGGQQRQQIDVTAEGLSSGAAFKSTFSNSFWFFAAEFIVGAVTAKALLTMIRGKKDPDMKGINVTASGLEGTATTAAEFVYKDVPSSGTGMIQAARSGDASRVADLLKAGAKVDAEDEYGCTALHVAASRASVTVARELLKRGAFVNAREAWDEVPLHFAARSGSAELCELLLSHGAAVNAINADDLTPLLAAAQSKSEDACRVLLKHGGGVGEAADDELPPLLQRLFMERCLFPDASA